MKVLCVKLISPVDGSQQTDSGWMTLHREYLVLSILMGRDINPVLQVWTDRDSAGWFSAEMFMTTDTSIPPNWAVKVREGGVIELTAARWQDDGFWERYYDGDAEAVHIFEEELAVMQAASARRGSFGYEND